MTIPFHGDATSVANLHRPGFVSESDPAAETGMAPWKLWIEVDGSNAFVALHLRNAANDDWITVITADDLATQAELDAAIAALKDGVSTSFDTLAELATTLLDHHTRHESGGADAIKLDDLAAPDDNTDLDVSITAHGLAPKLPNDAAKFLNGVGSYTTPTGSGIPATIVDAKGDLIAATAADTVARVAVGADTKSLLADSGQAAGVAWGYPPYWFAVACSDETTAVTAGAGKATFRLPACNVLAVRASATTAPTDADLVIDINESGASILSTKLSIDATEKTSTTAATPAVISDASIADDAEITIDFDQVGSTVAGAGVKVYLYVQPT